MSKLKLADLAPEGIGAPEAGIAVDAMKPNDTQIREITRTEYPTTKADMGVIVREDIR